MDRRNLVLGSGALALTGAVTVYGNVRQMGTMGQYIASTTAARGGLPQLPEAVDFIRFATLAANSHNTQPWRFEASANSIEILPDFSRRIPVVDPDDHHIFASLGCAAENLALAAAARGRAGELQYKSGGAGSIVFTFGMGAATGTALFDAIPFRQSTRSDYDGRPVSAANLATLANAAKMPGVDLVMLTDRFQINRVRDLVLAANAAQISDPAFVRELKTWLRFNPRQAIETKDGLFSELTGGPILPTWLGQPMFDWFYNADTENNKCARQLASSPGVAIFVSAQNNAEHWLLAGRASQRFALQATALGMKHAFVNQPVEVARFRPELAALVGLPDRRPDLVMRFGYGDALPFSARRPVLEVLT